MQLEMTRNICKECWKSNSNINWIENKSVTYILYILYILPIFDGTWMHENFEVRLKSTLILFNWHENFFHAK